MRKRVEIRIDIPTALALIAMILILLIVCLR